MRAPYVSERPATADFIAFPNQISDRRGGDDDFISLRQTLEPALHLSELANFKRYLKGFFKGGYR